MSWVTIIRGKDISKHAEGGAGSGILLTSATPLHASLVCGTSTMARTAGERHFRITSPKPHGGGTRRLGVPTVADRIAQTVVARRLEGKVEATFHPDSFGYRPGRSALDAVAACRE